MGAPTTPQTQLPTLTWDPTSASLQDVSFLGCTVWERSQFHVLGSLMLCSPLNDYQISPNLAPSSRHQSPQMLPNHTKSLNAHV